jgi:hypothetical protein
MCLYRTKKSTNILGVSVLGGTRWNTIRPDRLKPVGTRWDTLQPVETRYNPFRPVGV